MKRQRKVPWPGRPSRNVGPRNATPLVDERPIIPRRRHPLLLLLVAAALAGWLAFLAYLAFRG